jgi:hypothetical protein
MKDAERPSASFRVLHPIRNLGKSRQTEAIMRQMALSDDEIFERQQIRKLAMKDEPTPVAVLPGRPSCAECVFWRPGLKPGPSAAAGSWSCGNTATPTTARP